METLQLLESLCTAHGVSGSEHAAAEVAMNALKPYAESVWSDDYANVYAHIRSAKEGNPRFCWKLIWMKLDWSLPELPQTDF